MKTKFRFLIISLALFFTGLATANSIAQKDAQTKSEPQKVIIDIGGLGEKMGVAQEETVIPDGSKLLVQKWNKAQIQKAVADLKQRYTDPKNTYLVTNSPNPAITLAFIQALQPFKVLYLYMKPGGDEIDMCELKKVKQAPAPASNYDANFEIKEDGDKLFINFNSDSAEAALKGHTFDIKNTCKLVIPEIPAGKHVFLHAKGRYCVMVAVAFNYVKGSKSVSIACHEEDYTCAVSFSDKIEIGQVTPRTLPNNL